MEKEKNKINSYLSFKIGNELYAANVSNVLNILELTKITKVPKAPEYMKGVINLRGTVLPVVDTRIKFGMTETEYTSKTCILVIEIKKTDSTIQLGALVDSVQEVLELENEDIKETPSIGKTYHSEFIQGVTRQNDEFIMLLDIEKLFSNEEVDSLKLVTPNKEVVA